MSKVHSELSQRYAFLGSRVGLRPVEENDIDKLIKWDSDEEIVRWTGKQFSDKEEAVSWYLHKHHLLRRSFIIELHEGISIGEIQLVNISWRLHSAEIRIAIGETRFWSKGFGQDAISALLRGLFRSTTLREIYLRVDDENARAKRCYFKIGFRAKGKVEVPIGEGRDGFRRLILMTITQESFEMRGGE